MNKKEEMPLYIQNCLNLLKMNRDITTLRTTVKLVSDEYYRIRNKKKLFPNNEKASARHNTQHETISSINRRIFAKSML